MKELAPLLSSRGVAFLNAPVMSLAAKNAANLMLAKSHAPMFPIDLVKKDFRYVMQSAREVDAVIPVSTAIHNIYLDAAALGYGGNNITGVARLLFDILETEYTQIYSFVIH